MATKKKQSLEDQLDALDKSISELTAKKAKLISDITKKKASEKPIPLSQLNLSAQHGVKKAKQLLGDKWVSNEESEEV